MKPEPVEIGMQGMVVQVDVVAVETQVRRDLSLMKGSESL